MHQEQNVPAACPPPRTARPHGFDTCARRPGLLAASAMTLALAACGGGGGGHGFLPVGSAPAPAAGPAPAPAPAPATPTGPVTMSGVVASGAPFAGAQLTAVDKTGATVCDTVVSAQGAYACELPATTQMPLVITAREDSRVLYSVSSNAAGGRVNVTPLTSIIASRLSPAGDASLLAAAIKVDPAALDPSKIQAQVAQLLAALKPLLDAIGDATDPLTGEFLANGSGHDRVLDAVGVSIKPDGTAANIEITVRARPATATDTGPIAIVFRSDAPPPTLPSTLTSAALVPPGSSQAIAALLAKITACYALPLSQRVNAPNDTAAVVGGAADVKAPTCRTAFVNDDPSTYLNNGSKVGRDASGNGSFSGFFRPGATGAIFDSGVLEFFRPNGDMVMTFRTLDTLGNTSAEITVVRAVGGEMKLVGNQHVYSAAVRPSVQIREFVNAPDSTYFNVGYNFSLSNVKDVNGASIFTKIVATGPDGSTVTFVPTVGSDALRIRKPDGTVINSSFVRLAAAYKNPSTPGSPSTIDNLYYVSPQYTDAQIAALPDQSVWTFEFFHVDPQKPNVVQSQRTLQRPFTLAESTQVKFAQLTSDMRALLIAQTSGTGRYMFGPPNATTPNAFYFNTMSGGDAYTVPPLAVAPNSFTIFGNAPTVGNVVGAAFDDSSANLASSARRAAVFCSRATVSDAHCDSSTGVLQFAQGTQFNYLQLSANSLKQMSFYTGTAVYRP